MATLPALSVPEVRAACVAALTGALAGAGVKVDARPVEWLTRATTPDTGLWAVSVAASAAVQDSRLHAPAEQRDTRVTCRVYLALAADRTWGASYDGAFDQCAIVEQALYGLCSPSAPVLGVRDASTAVSEQGSGRYLEATVNVTIRHRWRVAPPQ